jgi:hypothetical protein
MDEGKEMLVSEMVRKRPVRLITLDHDEGRILPSGAHFDQVFP